MTPIKPIAFGLLLSACLSLVYSGIALSANGTVVLRDEDKKICTLTVPEQGETQTFEFDKIPCENWNDRARSIQLTDVPSGTKILLTDDMRCKLTDKYWIQLKTTKKQTTTPIIDIQYLTSYQPNQIIEPGLQMVDLYFSGSISDKLSCLRISTSAVPPSASTTTP